MKKSIKQLVLLSIIAFLFICGTPCFAQFLPANIKLCRIYPS